MTSNERTDFTPDPAVIEQWENGKLGRSEEHARVVSPAAAEAVDQAMGLQLISIRLQRDLVKNLKFIAGYNGMNYQPLVRELLNRFVASELKQIAFLESKKLQSDSSVVDGFLARESERKRA